MIDVVNKFIVFSTQIESVIGIFVEFGTCYIMTSNKQVFNLDEKDLQSKLNVLFKKNLYDTAVKIAKNNQYDAEGFADIFKQYGDHLYTKGNFGGAVDQYIKTIGYLEPSYVIRRFLDSRHTQYLTDYLEVSFSGQLFLNFSILFNFVFSVFIRKEKLRRITPRSCWTASLAWIEQMR